MIPMFESLMDLYPTKTIKWKDFFEAEIKEEPFVILQIEPDRTIDNGRNLESITNSFHALQRSIFKRVQYNGDDNTLIICWRNHVSYEIYYEYGKILFRYTCPSSYEAFLRAKIQNAFPRSTIKKISTKDDVLNNFTSVASYTELIQKEHFFKSLAGDYRANAPLPSLINVVKNLQNGDKALIQFVFNPLNEVWKQKAMGAWIKYRKGDNVEKKESGIWSILDWVFFDLIEKFFRVLDIVMDMGVNTTNNEVDDVSHLLRSRQRLSVLTTQKTNYDGFDVYVRLLSEADDRVRAEQTVKSIITALKDIASDNELIPKHGVKKVGTKRLGDIQERRIPLLNTNKNIWCSKEVAQVVQMPNAQIQEEYKGIINSIETREVELPLELLKGTIPLGTVQYKGRQHTVYWNHRSHDYFALPKVWQGHMRSGKTTAGKNFIRETQINGYWNLVIDVNDGSLVDDVVNTLPENYPQDKIIILDFTNPDFIFRLGFNEAIKLAQLGASSKQAERNCSKMADILVYFLNATTAEPLSDRMTRYFISAVRLCLLNGYSGIESFTRCLTDYKFRVELCEKSQGKIREKVLQDMDSLNIYSKKGDEVVDTVSSTAIIGIADRANKLLQSDLLEDCFMDNPNVDIDFRKWFDEGYFVGIKANKDAVGGFETCNVLVTFLVQKAWSAILSRYDDLVRGKDLRLGFVTLDEPHSFPSVCTILTGAIRESAKWRCGFNFMVHDLDDLGVMLPKLIDAGSNFIMYRTSFKNYRRLESLMKPFTIEEALETKQYHALHILDNNGERVVFDAKSLKPPNERYPVVNNVAHMTKSCWDRYGN